MRNRNNASYFRSLLSGNILLYIGYATVFSFVYAMPIFPGLVLQKFFNSLQREDVSNVYWLAGILLAIGIARAMAIMVGIYLEVLFRIRIATALRLGLAKAFLNPATLSKFDQSPGDILPIVRDDVNTVEDVFALSVDILGMSAFILGTFYVLLSIDAGLTLLVFLPITVVVSSVQYFDSKLQSARRIHREATDQSTGFVYSVINAVDQIKASNLQLVVGAHYQDVSENRSKFAILDEMAIVSLDTFYASVVTIGTALILFVSAGDISSGEFGIGSLAVFVYYLGFVSEFTKLFGKFLTSLSQSTVSFQRLSVYTPSGSFGKLDPPLPKKTNSAKKLCFRLVDELGETTLELAAGDLLVINGATGSGKTHLIERLIGIRSSSRQYSLDGKEFHTGVLDIEKVSYSPHDFGVFEGDLLDNYQVRDSKELYSVLRRAGFEKTEYDDLKKMDIKGSQFSGGQIRRMSNACAMLAGMDLVFLDNPTESMDAKAVKYVVQSILDSNATRIVVTNHPDLIERADHIIRKP